MVGCLSENTIQELVAGALSGDALAQAQQHVDTCSVCRTLAIELARDGDAEVVGTLPTPANITAGLSGPALAGRFEILRRLGRGGMGVVYEAFDRQRGARVALKTLQHVSADGLLRFKTEFRALQDVSHPNLVTFGELLEDRGQWWLTMELVEGVAFLSHVRPGSRLDEPRLRAGLAQLAAALAALHAHGLVHRDVKPHNVLVTPAGRVVLLDFGLVAGVAQSESNVVGTPAYMAPEQGLLQDVGPAADWYAVGALLYEALTGALPFTGAPLQVLVAKQHLQPRRPRDLAIVPEDLDALCMQLLAVEPAARLGAASALGGLAVGAAPASPPVAVAGTPGFVGRRRELDRLAEAFAETRAGTEAIVLVDGESGIGKSALARQFLAELHRRAPEVLVLAGRCYEREMVPYKGIDGVIDALARHLRKLPEADAAAVLPRRAGLLVHAFPVLGKVPALRRLQADEVIDPVELRLRAFAALRELLGRLAERKPVVVWIDDLQWADADSLELLAWVMARPEAPVLLLLLTSRPPREETAFPTASSHIGLRGSLAPLIRSPGRDPMPRPPLGLREAAGGSSTEAAMARVRELPGLRLLALLPLPPDEAVALAEQLLAETPAWAPISAAAVAEEAAGHPLFIDALVRHTAARPLHQPSLRLSDALWARIAEIDSPARQVLALIAVAGRPLSLELLTAAAELPAGEIDPALARLRHAHLVRMADRAEQGVEPYHDRVREAVLDQLPPEPRKACHRALARALVAAGAGAGIAPHPPNSRDPGTASAPQPASASDASSGPEAVAVHLHAAGDLEPAAGYMVGAADQSAAALAFDRAARLYRQALAIHDEAAAPGPLGDPRDVLARLARALVNAGRGGAAAAVYFELARGAGAGSDEDLELRLRGAEQLLRSGHRDEGQRALAEVLDALGLRPPATRVGGLWRLLRRRAWVRLRGLGAFTRDHRGTPSPRERLRMDACRVASMTTDLGPEYITRYQALALKAGDPRSIGLALVAEIASGTLRGVGARRIARLFEILAALAERSADPYVLGQEQTARALVELARGRWARGREHGTRAMQLFRERCLGAFYETAFAALYHLICLFYLGQLEDFMHALPPLLREAEERGDQFTLAWLHVAATGLVSLFRDQPEVARGQVERGIVPWTTVVDLVPQRNLAAQLARAEIELYEGDGAAAFRRLDLGFRRMMRLRVARLGFARSRAFSVHGLSALAAARSVGGDRRLVRAAARDARDLRAMRMPWTDALARVLDAGIALATGGRAAARAQLERAQAELGAAGMALHATMARRRLGELAGGAAGAREIIEADAWLTAQGVGAPERLARVFMPEVA